MASPLEQPPPPPAQVGQPGPPPSASQLAGDPSSPQGGGDQSIQLVTQHLMEAEQALQAAVRIKPELAGIVEKFTNEVKPQAGQILFGRGAQAGAAGSGGAPPIGTAMLASGAPGLGQRP
jgi:hypothetical protein